MSLHRFAALLAVPALAAAAWAEPAPPVDAPHRSYGDWTSSKIGGGGYILGTRFTSDPLRLWAWTDVGGAYRSDDGGHAWTQVAGSLPYGGTGESRGMMYVRDLLSDPEDPDRCLIAIGYQWSPRFGIYRTVDAGGSWERVHEIWASGDAGTRGHGSVLDRSPSDPSVIWAVGLKDGTAVSRDNGDTWTPAGGPSVQPSDIRVDATDPDRVWVAASAMDEYAPADRANTGGNKLVLPGGLWRTDDAGKTWRNLLMDEGVRNLAQDPNDPGRLLALRDGGKQVAVSTDLGETWSPLMDGLNPPFNGGESWNSPRTYANFAEDASVLYLAATQADAFRLSADGNRWEKLGPMEVTEPEGWWGASKEHPSEEGWVNTLSAVSSIDVSPHDPDELVMTDWYSVYRSYDGGQSWTNMTEGIEVTYVDALEQDPTDPDVVHLGVADIGYFRSDDGGASFTGHSRDNIVTNNVKSIAVPASEPDRVYALSPAPPWGGWYGGHPFRSDNSGLDWVSPGTEGLPEISLDAHHGHTIASPDGSPDTAYLAVSLAVEEGGGGLYRTDDAGATWARDSEGLPEGVEFFRHKPWGSGREVAIAPNGTMLANSIENGLLYRRAAGEETWEEVRFPASGGKWNDVRADPHAPADGPARFYGAGEGTGMYRSVDDGLTWEKLDTPDAAPGPCQLILDRVVPGRLAAGTLNGVILSRDGGDSWVVLDQRLPGRVGWNKGAFAGDRLVVGSGGMGCFWTDVSE